MLLALPKHVRGDKGDDGDDVRVSITFTAR